MSTNTEVNQAFIEELKTNIKSLEATIVNKSWPAGYIANCKESLAFYEKTLADINSRTERPRTTMPFYLEDEIGAPEDDATGMVDSTRMGLGIQFDGYSDRDSQDNVGKPVYIEQYNGEVRVLVYANINSEEPTHVISLEGARNEKRLEENE